MLILPMLGDQPGNAVKLEVYGMALRFMNNNLEINDEVSKVKRFEGIKDENGCLMIDNNVLLKEWMSPGSRIGFIRGSYLDVYTVAVNIEDLRRLNVKPSFILLIKGLMYDEA
ncbi:UDP-Glycosyltransferase/glycogen phosphorylase [Gigaspora margarita]|uniref:UDP-Glycosyltransferase/glycogen phosphorylase n=1 Tax=Gigaspora margarita TaxID=4874 RepID=A0A8H3XMP8_GIGMA|nr:UDP-Glycosyltransferase/glycogen phosphorylase [Gigaspora margarita]